MCLFTSKYTFLDTNGNNDVASIVRIGVHLQWVTSVFSLRNLCIYLYISMFLLCIWVSLRQTALQCEHVCIYALVQVSASQRVYVFVHKDTEGGWGGGRCLGVIAWKLFYCMFFSSIWLNKGKKNCLYNNRVETFKLFKGISLFWKWPAVWYLHPTGCYFNSYASAV